MTLREELERRLVRNWTDEEHGYRINVWSSAQLDALIDVAIAMIEDLPHEPPQGYVDALRELDRALGNGKPSAE